MNICKNTQEEKMRAEAKSLRFLGESPQKLSIPFFQRGYVWGEANWEELLNSLKGEASKPFLGSIIIKKVDCDNPTEAQVIDGQQRLTTLTLLSKAIYDTLTLDIEKLSGTEPYDEEDDDKYGKSDLKSFLFYRVNAADPFKKAQVKIQHSKVDRNAYECIIRENLMEKDMKYCNNIENIKMDDEQTSPILKCYKYFRERLLQMKIEEIIELHNSMYSDGKKMLVLITMDLDDDNEQSIFDTINRAGVHLSVSDIIKNDLFKKCLDLSNSENEEDEVIRMYEEKWEKVFYIYPKGEKHIWENERIFGNQQRTNLDFLLYCVAFVNWGKKDNIFSDLANVYKTETQDMTKEELFCLIEQIHTYAITFKKYIIELQNSYKLDEEPMSFSYNDYKKRLLLILEVFGVQMFYPYVLKLLVEQEQLGDEFVKREFKILETFVTRRRLASKGVSDYATKCDYLIKNDSENLINEINESEDGITNTDLARHVRYIKSENAKLLLFIIELYKRRDEMHDVNSLAYRYTLEHIMPRNWQKHWLDVPQKKEDGSDYIGDDGNVIQLTSEEGQLIRKQHVESIGNMTLLTQNLNSSIKNNTFQKKIDGEGKNKPGYRQYSSLFITKEIIEKYDCGSTIWNEGKIDIRTNELYNMIIEIWPSKF